MRYYSKIDEGHLDPEDSGGYPTYWLEINAAGDANRQLIVYPNGKVFSYDELHLQDQFGALAIMVIDGDENWWEPYQITKKEFMDKWNSHLPLNRSTYLR